MSKLIRNLGRVVLARRSALDSARVGRGTLAIATLTIVAVGCAGDDDAVTSTTATNPPATSSPVTSETTGPSTTTTDAPPTSAATTAPTPTSPPTSTQPPDTRGPSTQPPPSTSTTSTGPQLDETQAAVAAAYAAAFDSWTDCLAALPMCDPATLDPYRTGDYLLMSRTQVGLYNDAGQTTTNLERRELTIESIAVDASGAQATVQSCEVDGVVRYNAAGEVVNDDLESVRRASIVVLEGEQWKVAGFENLEVGSTESDNVCAG